MLLEVFILVSLTHLGLIHIASWLATRLLWVVKIVLVRLCGEVRAFIGGRDREHNSSIVFLISLLIGQFVFSLVLFMYGTDLFANGRG